MAKIISITYGKNRIDCLLSGTLGDKVYYVKNGIQYTRSSPVHTLKPKSEAQLDQSAKFTSILKFLQPLTAFLRVGFKSQTANISAFNAAMSYNFKNALTGTYPEYAINYSRVLVSCGTLKEALNPEVTLSAIGKIEFNWKDNSNNTNSLSNDHTILVVYNPEKQQAITVLSGNTRENGCQTITLPSSFAGDKVQCYIAFQNAKQTDVSNSQFVSSLIVI